MERMGFMYDSSVSVNSFYNKTDCKSLKIGTKPYYPLRGSLNPGNDKRIMEIPWPYFQFGLRFPTAGGPLLRLLGARYIRRGLKQSLDNGDTFFYFHPIDISEESFPASFSFKRSIYWRFKGATIEERIRCIMRSFTNLETGTCRQILEKGT